VFSFCIHVNADDNRRARSVNDGSVIPRADLNTGNSTLGVTDLRENCGNKPGFSEVGKSVTAGI
jgi:hypothetical protein